MPSRKSDQRKSDVSTLQSPPTDGHPETNSDEVAPPPETPAADASSKAQSQKTPATQEKGEKEKDKDKDKSKDQRDAVTIEDLTLPKSIIARLAKGALPPNTQIQANAMLALNRSATVIINYLASHANEHTVNGNRKTISPEDVFKALADVDMDFMREHLEREFEVFNSIQTEKRTNYRQKARAAKHTMDGPSNPGEADDTDMADASLHDTAAATTTGASEPSGPRAAKKARVEAAAAAGVVAGAAAAAGAAAGGDDADTEEEPDAEEEEDDEEDDEEEAEEEDEDEEEQDEPGSGDETQDALEERGSRLDGDEAVDDDDSD